MKEPPLHAQNYPAPGRQLTTPFKINAFVSTKVKIISGMVGRKLRIMPGQDSSSHGEYARPVLLELLPVVGDHRQNLFIVLAAEQGVASDHGALLSFLDNDGSMAGDVSGGEKALQVLRQRMLFNPPELGRAAQSFGIPPAQRQFT